MDTAEIDVFSVLAEELHFGRTAERLHLPQPQVSRLIARLETRVGGKLFDRTTRRVRLTPLGEQLRAELVPAYTELQDALGRARAAARGLNGQLRIGCTTTTGCPALLTLVEVFTASNPHCELSVHDVDMKDPYTLLRRGAVDVLVNWLAGEEPDLTAGPVIEYRDRVLLVGRGHRLAGQESVSAEELGDEEVHETVPTFPEAVYNVLVPAFTPSGRPIRRTHPWRSTEDVTRLIAHGRIVHPTVTGVMMYNRPDLVLVPIRDLPPIPLGLIWCTAHENARIRALAATARQLVPCRPAGMPRDAG